MRILVAAIEAQKGDLGGNLARHLAVLEQARAQGCQLAVFPELSLTGSVDPCAHPERALPVEAGPVRALLAATSRTGVAALFGIAERDGGRSTSPSCTATTAGSAASTASATWARAKRATGPGGTPGCSSWGRPGSGSPCAPRVGSTSSGTTPWPAGRRWCASARPRACTAPHRRAGLA